MTPPTKLGMGTLRIRCHACSGQFSLGEEHEKGEPVAVHTLPYCEAFNRIETVVDAVRFSEACRAADRSRQS